MRGKPEGLVWIARGEVKTGQVRELPYALSAGEAARRADCLLWEPE